MNKKIDDVKSFLLSFQERLCVNFENLDGSSNFKVNKWNRESGGGGETRVIAGDGVFEKGGVNFSHVFGDKLPPSATVARPELVGRSFQALGVSVVMHPQNPFIPTSHANLRLFIAEKTGCEAIWWFGGGFDLTPYYGFKDDCKTWHSTAREACQPFGDDVYPAYKKWCDDYFYISHRKEQRGIGGLFFDDLNHWPFDKSFDFVKSVGSAYLSAYKEIVLRRHMTKFDKQQKLFQQMRRGRYVEFNLVYDRGTLFGLQSGGRSESILISMPPDVKWLYDELNHHPDQKNLKENYLIEKNWLNEE